MNILIFPHLGLGDQFIMNGYVHYLLNTSPDIIEICIIAKQFQQKTLEYLYSDSKKVSFYWVQETSERSGSSWEEKDLFLKSINHAPFGVLVNYKNRPFVLHNFGCHTQIFFDIHRTNWADAFYYQANVDPIYRTLFVFPSTMAKSQEVYERVVKTIGNDYILIHDDPSRDRFIDTHTLTRILEENNSKSVPILYLGRDRYDYPLQPNLNNQGSNELLQVDSVLDYYTVIKNAKECHFMDSSIGILTDFIKESSTKLYNHIYITTEAPGTSSAQRINYLREWTYLPTKYA
jgi:hypothetical protein